MNAVFIRAPKIIRANGATKVLARFKGEPVAVKEGSIIACSFHPELTTTKFHEEFLKLPLENVYSLNLSKTTKKANAMFAGLGRTKRLVLP